MTKGERREGIRKNQRKMAVRGRSIFTLLRLKAEARDDALRNAPQRGII